MRAVRESRAYLLVVKLAQRAHGQADSALKLPQCWFYPLCSRVVNVESLFEIIRSNTWDVFFVIGVLRFSVSPSTQGVVCIKTVSHGRGRKC